MEIFKGEPSPKDALHSKFNVFDGSEIEEADEVGQLQICAISMYLLTLVQMITSNLEVNPRSHRARQISILDSNTSSSPLMK